MEAETQPWDEMEKKTQAETERSRTEQHVEAGIGSGMEFEL